MQTDFKNTAVELTEAQRVGYDGNPDPYRYRFNAAPVLLFTWSRLFQSVISQVGSYMLTQKYHDSECGIYKCEGGCRIVGGGDLVLSRSQAYWDHGRSRKEIDLPLVAMNGLISAVVLKWNPMDPIESMLKAAVDYNNDCPLRSIVRAKKEYVTTVEDLRKALDKGRSGGPFGGNALSDFFNWNPFSRSINDIPYERWCRINIMKEDEAVVDQDIADRHLGWDLLEKMEKKGREFYKGSYFSGPMCCSPRRSEKGLGFWINTGRRTQIDGWKTVEEINEYLNGTGELIDKATY